MPRDCSRLFATHSNILDLPLVTTLVNRTLFASPLPRPAREVEWRSMLSKFWRVHSTLFTFCFQRAPGRGPGTEESMGRHPFVIKIIHWVFPRSTLRCNCWLQRQTLPWRSVSFFPRGHLMQNAQDRGLPLLPGRLGQHHTWVTSQSMAIF